MGKSHEFFVSSILKIMGPNSAEDGGNTNPLILNGRNQPIACNHHADSSQHNLWVSTWVTKEKTNQQEAPCGLITSKKWWIVANKRLKIHG